MASLNKVMLIGRLGKDPEVRQFDSGAMKVSFSIATSEKFTNKQGEKVENTEWHNIVMWGKLAEIAEKYLRKGKEVYIEGRIKTRSWEDQNGQKRYATDINAMTMQLLGGSGGGGNEGGYGGGQGQQQQSNNQQDQGGMGGNMQPAKPDMNAPIDDDLPF